MCRTDHRIWFRNSLLPNLPWEISVSLVDKCQLINCACLLFLANQECCVGSTICRIPLTWGSDNLEITDYQFCYLVIKQYIDIISVWQQHISLIKYLCFTILFLFGQRCILITTGVVRCGQVLFFRIIKLIYC